MICESIESVCSFWLVENLRAAGLTEKQAVGIMEALIAVRTLAAIM